MTISVTHSTPADSSFSSTGATAWNADHTLTGVGTVAEQNANAVAITGGNIDGTVIGNTTPAAGTFTTLTATTGVYAGGAGANVDLNVNSKGTGAINFSTSNGVAAKIVDSGATTTNYVYLKGGVSGAGNPVAIGGATSGLVNIFSSGGSNMLFTTAGYYNTAQLNIAHTASAVNYVQVTGAATGGQTLITAQGSDSSIDLGIKAKGSYDTYVGNASGWGLRARGTSSTGNYFQIAGVNAGSAPVLSVIGGDTNIDLTLTPKGTGNVRFGTYTGTALAIAGYIEIKDAGGTVRKLAVVA